VEVEDKLSYSKKFCEANASFMDGVIAETHRMATSSGQQTLALACLNWLVLAARTRWFQPCLTIKPQAPSEAPFLLSALFNQGNILEDSYKEEFIDYGSGTQDVVLTGIYRTLEGDSAFAKNASVQVQLSRHH
jgi:hypothetical protein